MKELIRGQRAKLSEMTPSRVISVRMALQFSGDHVFDVCCLGIDASGKMPDRYHFLYHNRHEAGDEAERGPEQFALDLDNLRPGIERLVFGVAIVSPGTMSQLTRGELHLMAGEQEIGRYVLRGEDFLTEKAIIVGEFYQKDGWRFAAVGQGFLEGIEALLDHFGAKSLVADLIPPLPRPSAPQPHAADGSVSASGALYVNRYYMEEPGDKVIKRLGGQVPLMANLNWVSSSGGPRPDVHLGCFYRLHNGEQGVIMGLGDLHGAIDAAPYIYLADEPDAPDGGPLLVFTLPATLAWAAVFAFAYDRADFTETPARLMYMDGSGYELGVRLTRPRVNGRVCLLSTLQPLEDRFELANSEQYFTDLQALDEHLKVGFKWREGPNGSLIPQHRPH